MPHVTTNPGTPARGSTPIETALAYNASLADSNQTLAEAVIEAQKTGLIPVTVAGNIGAVQFTVADADRQITAILEAIGKCLAATPAGPTCKGNAAQLQILITRISTNANSLIASGDIGIKDEKTAAEVANAVKTIVAMAGLVLDTVQKAGLIQ